MNVNAILMLTFFNVLEIHVVSNIAQKCKPTISEGKHGKLDIGGHTYIACHITTCNKVYAVRFEKTNLYTPRQWTPVYEKGNKTYHYTVMTDNANYTLQNRTDYVDFPTHHILSISPLKLEDQGEWRCVVYDHTNHSVESSTINIFIYEIGKVLSPKEEMTISVNPNSTFTLNCSGFGNLITWQQDGVDVIIDRYIQKSECNNTSGICTSNITSKALEDPWTCENVMEFAGVYTCAVTQKPSCTSKHTSPKMTVQVFYKPFVKEVSRNITACIECEVTLSCDICYDKNSTSTWTYNEEILPNETVEYKDDGSVMINKIHHFGKYTRTVKNELGEAQCELNLSSCGLSCNSNVVAFVFLALGCLACFMTAVCVGVYVWNSKCKNNFSPTRAKRPGNPLELGLLAQETQQNANRPGNPLELGLLTQETQQNANRPGNPLELGLLTQEAQQNADEPEVREELLARETQENSNRHAQE